MKRERYEEFEARVKKTTVTLEDVISAIGKVAEKLGSAGLTLILALPLIMIELDPEAPKKEDDDEENEPKEGEARL